MSKIKQPRFNLDLPTKLVKLTKINGLYDAQVPNKIPDGFVIYGKFLHPPEVGKRFFLGFNFLTSRVQEIIDDNTFKTMNSVYRWEVFNNEQELIEKEEEQ